MDRINRLASILANGTSRVAADAPPYSLSHEEYLKANKIMGALGIIGALNRPGDLLHNDTETIRLKQQHSHSPQDINGIRYLLANYIDKGKPLPRKRWVSGSRQAAELELDEAKKWNNPKLKETARALLDEGNSPAKVLQMLTSVYKIEKMVAGQMIREILDEKGNVNGAVHEVKGNYRESGRRVAQPQDDFEYRPDEHVRPSTTEFVDPTAKIYRDTDDLREEADEDSDEEKRDKSVLLFGGDDDDDGLDNDDDAEVGKDTLRKSRLKLLAGMIWAELGEADAVVEESAPNELSVRVQDLAWKITVDDDGKVQISGFDSGAEQFVGQIPDEDAEAEIVKVADHIHQLIAEDIDEKSTPAEPPVHFGPEDTGVEGETEGAEETPPVAPGGDEGVYPEEAAIPPDMGAPPGGGGEMPFGAGAPPAPAPVPPGGGMPPAGAIPPAAPPAPGGVPPAPAGFPPAASRGRVRLPSQVSRVATARLETVSNELESIGESLGEDGEEVFGELADRVRSVVDWID